MKPGKALTICYAVVLMSLNSTAQSTPITLKQCVDAAIAKNLTIKQSEFAMDRRHVGWKQGKANLLPTLNASVNHNMNNGRSIDPTTNSYVTQSYTSASYSLGTDLTLFNGLRLMNTLKSARYAYDASRASLQQQKDNITLDVIQAYLDVLTNVDLLAQAKKQVEVTQKQVDRLDILNQAGNIKPSDLYDMKGNLAENKMSVTNIQNALNTSRLRLSQLMNIPFNDNLEVERLAAEQFSVDYSATPDSIYLSALDHMGLVKAADLLVKSAQKDVLVAKGALWPTLSFGGGIDTRFSSTGTDATGVKVPYYDQLSNNYFTYFGLGLRIPILNALRNRHNVELSKIDLKDIEYQKETNLIQLKQAIERDHNNLETTKSKYMALVDQVAAYVENFRAAEIRFNEGASNSVDYLIAKNKLDAANLNLILARYDYVIRTKILDYYQGKMNY